MKILHPPIPPFATTNGTYWPNGVGTIPLPYNFPDDGSTYIVITVGSANVADSLDTLVWGGTDILGGAVTMITGDDDQSADDIVTQITTFTAGIFIGTAAANGQVVISRTDGRGVSGALVYTATTGGGTTFSITATPWVIDEAGAFPDGGYYILDALDPGVKTVYPEPVAPTFTDPAGPIRPWPPVTITNSQWLYLPGTHTMHQVVLQTMMGGSGLSAKYGTHLFVTLEPPLPSTITAPVVFRVMPMPPAGLTIKNTGGANGLLNGYTFINGDTFDRSQFPQLVGKPLTYNSTGTTFTITVNS